MPQQYLGPLKNVQELQVVEDLLCFLQVVLVGIKIALKVAISS